MNRKLAALKVAPFLCPGIPRGGSHFYTADGSLSAGDF